ncbi:hypothetical protein [Paenibacillus ihbetae]|uniref:Sporulation membrane protein YtrI C-terminal domain-containing protein n=1 Tax=Paenibacillus ihbetae TaxID=1870820 RepID=A0A1B2E4D2_9BACL|nr:hypothetical protein [Paenibacillus ihbetae]ANY74834.1 hypothetical protein BBD41_20970 [Paenibacillus ihbetae]OOC62998.1 hypothetical protein BBD40_14645 [Paenibacillus ihbetae]
MRVPPPHRFRPFYQAASIFVLGMIVGSIVYNSLYHAAYNKLWETNLAQQLQITQYEDDIATLKKYNKQTTVVREIKIRSEENISAPLDPLISKEIVKLMSEDLAVLRGRSVFDIDTDSKLTRSLLNDKIYTVREKDYKVQIRTMLVVDGVLQIWFTVTPVDAKSTGS